MAQDTQKQSTGETQESGRTKPKWTLSATHIFCDVCITAITKGLRPSTHFNTEGWKFVVTNFQKISGLLYEKQKLKNKWDLMKTEWNLWKELIGKETGLGWDPRPGTVDASPEWWKEKIQKNKDYAKFQNKGIHPDIVSKNDFMFGSTVATGEFAWTPSSNVNVSAKSGQNEDDIISFNESEDDPLQKSMDRLLQEDDTVVTQKILTGR